jgi:hypothetical protein
VRVHDNNRWKDFPFFSVTDGEQHGVGSKPSPNVGEDSPISNSFEQMKMAGDYDRVFWKIDARDLKRDLRASSFFEFKAKDIEI